jgi:glycosidase
MHCFRFLASMVFLLFTSAVPAHSFEAPAPEDLFIYQIVIDRFDNGNAANDRANPRATFNPSGPMDFHGGDLEGIRRRLGYIRGLGANAIWITPFVENVNSYHGYAAFDWYKVEPNFGTMEDLKRLVADANTFGIAVYFDLVAGHCGNLITSSDSGYPAYLAPPDTYSLRWRGSLRYPLPFNDLSFFHAHGHVGNFVAPEQELGELFGLDDLKTETREVRDAMYDIWAYWLRETGVSGFRVDTVKHVDMGFWADFLPRLRAESDRLGNRNFFVFGEVYGADDGYMRTYVGSLNAPPYKFDSALDFQYYYTSTNVFAHGSRPPSDIVGRLEGRASALAGHHLITPNFIDNHDVRRFMNVTGDVGGRPPAERVRRLQQALIFLMTAPGPPVLYYGTEQGFDGGEDPYNREDMFDGAFESGPSLGDNFDTESELYRFVRRLGRLRGTLAPLRRGDFTRRAVATGGPGHLAFTRSHEGKTLLVVMNTATTTATLPALTLTPLAGQTLVDAFNPVASLIVGTEGGLTARALAPQAAELWLAAADLPPEPPEVVGFDPAHGETNVSAALTEATIRFLDPMNPDTTAAAIRLTPFVPWHLSWDAEGRVATLHFEAPLAGRTEYTLLVETTATSAEGAALGVPVWATWTTGRATPVPPPLPTPYPALPPTTAAIVVDGSAADWPAPAVGLERNSASFPGGDTFLWLDALGDDTGPGTYIYPTNSAFSGEDADLDEFRVAWNDTTIHLLIKPAGVNAGAGFFTPYFGVGIDLGVEGGRTTALGYDQSQGGIGAAQLLVRPDYTPEFEVVFTGPRGATLVNAQGAVIATPASAYSQQTGIVEIGIPRAALGLDGPLFNQPFNLIVYTGLEIYGSMREIAAQASSWDPGGGIAESTDPNVFDLAGAPTEALQRADLGNFDAAELSMVVSSILQLRLGIPAADYSGMWLLY